MSQPEASTSGVVAAAEDSDLDTCSSVTILKVLCKQFGLGEPQYVVERNTGSHHVTVRARLGMFERVATANTTYSAHQLAAESMYRFMCKHIDRLTKDFYEALVRAQMVREAQEMQAEATALRESVLRMAPRASEEAVAPPVSVEAVAPRVSVEAVAPRVSVGAEAPRVSVEAGAAETTQESCDLSQRVTDILGLSKRIDKVHIARAVKALADASRDPPQLALEKVCSALRLRVEWQALDGVMGVRLEPTHPTQFFSEHSPDAAAACALRYLRGVLLLLPPILDAN